MCYNRSVGCKMITITFFGHRELFNRDIRNRLKAEIEKYLGEDIHCIIGTHGEFDSLALSVCRELRRSYPNIKITVVFTTLNVLQKGEDELCSTADLYNDVETAIYDIEEEHYKRQIIVSNQRMVDDSDMVICYVDMERYQSGAKKAVKYALKKGKQVINLFKEEDKPFYGMTREEIDALWEETKKKIDEATNKQKSK